MPMPTPLKLISADNSPGQDSTTATRPRFARRLSDKVLLAFHQACDQSDFEVADDLLDVLEFMAKRTEPGRDRRSEESLIAAHERLWLLRHPEFSY
jgi:hypothetical protein